MSERSKNILLGVLIVGLVSMTVAYAALQTSLTINGTAQVAATTWNIHITGWALDSSSTATATSTGTSLTGSNITKIENFTATLNKPGDFVKYNFSIANSGTIAAVRNSFNARLDVQTNGGTDQSPSWGTAVTQSATSYGDITNDPVVANITCTNDTPLAAGSSTSCSLTITYSENATSLVQTSQTAGQDQTVNSPSKKVTFNADWTYGQQ